MLLDDRRLAREDNVTLLTDGLPTDLHVYFRGLGSVGFDHGAKPFGFRRPQLVFERISPEKWTSMCRTQKEVCTTRALGFDLDVRQKDECLLIHQGVVTVTYIVPIWGGLLYDLVSLDL